MKFSEVELPSNKKLGFFFTFIFGLAALYLYVTGSMSWAYSMAAVAVIFLVVTIAKADILLPLNKLWMRFGLLLGMIVSPIVLGVIFFGLYTPIAALMRLSGRDELRLKFSSKASHWILRSEPIQSESFKNQF
jgi:hypothetical protein